MATRAQVIAEAKKHSATIDWAEGDTVYYADAPRGRKWDASDCHVICAAYDNNETPADARAFLISEMQHDTTECDCEECADPDDDGAWEEAMQRKAYEHDCWLQHHSDA